MTTIPEIEREGQVPLKRARPFNAVTEERWSEVEIRHALIMAHETSGIDSDIGAKIRETTLDALKRGINDYRPDASDIADAMIGRARERREAKRYGPAVAFLDGRQDRRLYDGPLPDGTRVIVNPAVPGVLTHRDNPGSGWRLTVTPGTPFPGIIHRDATCRQDQYIVEHVHDGETYAMRAYRHEFDVVEMGVDPFQGPDVALDTSRAVRYSDDVSAQCGDDWAERAA